MNIPSHYILIVFETNALNLETLNMFINLIQKKKRSLIFINATNIFSFGNKIKKLLKLLFLQLLFKSNARD